VKTPGRTERYQNESLVKHFSTALATKFILEGGKAFARSFDRTPGRTEKCQTEILARSF
jgi:hypothetical protein